MPKRAAELRLIALSALLAAFGSIALAVPAAAAGSGISPIFPEPVSPNGQNIYNLYEYISIPAIAVFLLVEGLLLAIIVKYRRKSPGEVPPQVHGNPTLEIAWTVLPLVLILGIGLISFIELQNDFFVSEAGVVVPDKGPSGLEVTISGHQFGWDYTYPQGFTVSSSGLAAVPLVVPTDTLVRIKVESTDVIHSYWVPSITGKTDAVPGYSNYFWMNIHNPGEWRGECAELCGAGHYTMQIRVQAMSQSDFTRWVSQQQNAAKATPTPKAASSPRTNPKPSEAPTASPSARPSASASKSP